MAASDIRILRGDFMYAEAPRWHDGRLYVSDFYAKEVVALDLNGARERIVRVAAQPSGLGWLPNGDLLVAAMREASVVRMHGGELERVATVGSPMVNDMVVSAEGRAYVGGMPDFDALLADGASIDEITFPREHLYLVEAGAVGQPGRARIVASDLQTPNGAVITADGDCLILAESMAMRLLAFDIDADGTLSGKRVWADLDGNPDGICLDAEGCVWAAIIYPPEEQGFVRVESGGRVKDRVASDRSPVAVALGGPDGDDLFMVEAEVVGGDRPEAHARGNSHVRIGKTDVPAATFSANSDAGVSVSNEVVPDEIGAEDS